MNDRKKVYEAIDGERVYQDGQVQVNNWNHPKRVGEYLTILRILLTEAETRWYRESDAQPTKTLDSIRKIGGVAVACMEENGIVNRGSV